LHIANLTETLIIDELTSIISVLLTISCIISFISIRTRNPKREKKLETIADYIFMAALVGILFIILLITFNFIELT